MPSVTIKREDAVQRWPVEKYEPLTQASTATLTSASSSTTIGFLPPISSWNFFIGLDNTQACAILRPVATEPVKEMAWTAGWSIRVWPTTEPEPTTRLKTPAGRPERAMISLNAWAEPGTSSAGLNTTVLP